MPPVALSRLCYPLLVSVTQPISLPQGCLCVWLMLCVGENFPTRFNSPVNRGCYLPFVTLRESSGENAHSLHVNTVSGLNDLGVNDT